MNVFEMLSFDFKEFVTSPAGILIIVGIICLLVGIVMFLKEGKKSKPTEEVKKDDVSVSNKPEEAPTAPVNQTPEVKEETPVVVPATSDGVVETPVPVVSETVNITEPVAPSEPVGLKPETPAITPVEVVPTPVVTPVEVKPEVTPVQTSNVVEPTPVVESLDSSPAQSTAYGGVSPEVKLNVEQEQPREIYGGANPLENTAPIPTATITEAYNAVSNPTVEQPVVETVPVSAPAVEQAQPEQPKEEVEKLEF